MVCIKLSIRKNLFPVHIADQNPSPFAECLYRVSRESFSQDRRSDLALSRGVANIAGKVLLGGITVCLRGKRVCGEYKRHDHQYAGQQNQSQSAARARWAAGGARFAISICSCHVVLSRGVPRWWTTSAESPVTSMDGDLIGCQKNVGRRSIVKLLE